MTHTPRLIDLRFQGQPEAIASYLLRDGDGAALIETGPATTLASLLSGLAEAGVAPEDVWTVLLTHIHLDHAGAAGSLAGRFLPNAVVYVHPAGLPHLADPEKLLRSAQRIYGDEMDRLWGEVLPVPAERLRPLEDGEVVRAGGRTLRALHTPGHASHHIAYLDEGSRAVYTGDVAGIRLPGIATPVPPTPPPDLDLEAWHASLRRLAELEPTTLYLTHFGGTGGAARHIDELGRRLDAWGDIALAELRAGRTTAAVAALLERRALDELSIVGGEDGLRARYALVSGYAMNVAGFERYFGKRGLLPTR